ncbi:hypothetical protein H6P81_015625 [Aristolochia fimbriata]|uniref:Uncharacterized protein n=1 Tax=Aristolochia fimbriata TaxID=158543 RepID=A0AAV7E621_ARIFI|nr:hypothetical protein H6P81_015625 [Aristolochia fimbriata]
MTAPFVNLIGGLRAFDHDVTVGEETIFTLALYMEGETSRLTYYPSGESMFGGHAMKCPALVDRSLPHGSLSRPLATGERVFFIPCPDSSEDEDVAAGPETFVPQSALRTVSQLSLPCSLADDFKDGEDLLGDFGAKASQRETTSLSESLTLWEASLVRSCGRLDLPLRGEPTWDSGTTFGYYSWWKEHMLPRFERGRLESTASMAAGTSGEEEGYDSDRSHPRRRKLKGNQQVGAPSANKKRAPFAALNGASASAKKKARVEAQPPSHPSPPTFLPLILETEPPHSSQPQPSCPQTSCPPVLEMEPPEP